MKKTLRQLLLPALALFACQTQADARFVPSRLSTVSEWSQVCAGIDNERDLAICNAKLHRGVAFGRSLGIFEQIVPSDGSLLQSRSGVLFQRSLNELITSVRLDSGLKTRVVLQGDVQCQSYAAAPDLVGRPDGRRHYGRLIDAWLKEYTDAGYRVANVRIGPMDGRTALQFEATTSDQRHVSGVYTYDAHANAGIFSTCDHPEGSSLARQNAEQFFHSVIGSARRYG